MKSKLILSTVILAIFGVVIFCYLYFSLPQYYFNMYPTVPLFFILLLVGSYMAVTIAQKKTSEFNTNVYMAVKGIKLLLCLVFAVLNIKLFEGNNYPFVIVFMLFYIISITLESWLFLKISKKLKHE